MLATLTQFAQDYTTDYYTYSTPDTASNGFAAGILIAYFLFIFVISVISVVAEWKIFVKAGRPGWAALVPIYSTLQLIWLAKKQWWWVLLLCIPIVNLVFSIMLYNEVAKAFGKDVGFTVLLILLPFIALPILAFGKAKYLWGDGENTGSASVPTPPITGAPAGPSAV